MRILSPSLPAMTVSVASSPIFFRMASSPFAKSAATYDNAGSACTRDRIVAAMRSRTSSRCDCAVPDSVIAINRPRVLDDRFRVDPALVLESLEKAAFAPGVAGNAAALLDQEKDRVVVAIEANLAHLLHVTR